MINVKILCNRILRIIDFLNNLFIHLNSLFIKIKLAFSRKSTVYFQCIINQIEKKMNAAKIKYFNLMAFTNEQ